jgi:hypothetical protein
MVCWCAFLWLLSRLRGRVLSVGPWQCLGRVKGQEPGKHRGERTAAWLGFVQ